MIGMLGVHTLLRVARRDNQLELLRQLFAGGMSAGDVVRLAPLFDSGWLEQPRYVPPWAADLRRVAAALAFSAFVGRIKLDVVDLERFVELEEE